MVVSKGQLESWRSAVTHFWQPTSMVNRIFAGFFGSSQFSQ
jgi:hypothetical protein